MTASRQTLKYKPGLADVLDRLEHFYGRKSQDRILAAFQIDTPAMETFAQKHQSGSCERPSIQERLEFWDSHLKARANLEDDSVPCAYPSEFDQGLYGGLIGCGMEFSADPQIGFISSMCAPLANDWEALPELKWQRSNPIHQWYLAKLDTFANGSKGKFGISHFVLIDGLNFCFELVGGTQAYLGLYECPDKVREAIDFGHSLNADLHRTFFEKVPLLAGGTCSYTGQWIPGRILNESIDPFHMTSVDTFEEWGREPVERIFGEFDGGIIHLHSNGRHLLEASATMKGLKAILLGDEKDAPACLDILPELRERAGDMPLIIEGSFSEFSKRLEKHELAGGVLYIVKNTPNVDAANRCMEIVRAYRE